MFTNTKLETKILSKMYKQPNCVLVLYLCPNLNAISMHQRGNDTRCATVYTVLNHLAPSAGVIVPSQPQPNIVGYRTRWRESERTRARSFLEAHQIHTSANTYLLCNRTIFQHVWVRQTQFISSPSSRNAIALSPQ